MASASALVSKPCACVSGGSSSAGSISTASRSRNRVGVLAAVQAMEVGGAARIETSGRCAVQFGFEPRRHVS
jgi:hypothetical protein